MRVSPEHKEVLKRFRSSAPVDVTALAESLGLQVWEDDTLAANVSGKIFKDSGCASASGFSISVKSSDAYVRRRFTVAHEIGHFLLHRDKIGSSLTDDGLYRSNLSTLEEIEANRLAADILMPGELVRDYVRKYGNENTSLLASIFKVSESAMIIRLGYRPIPEGV